jgi:REP element-mobilizing transposase RayT
MSRQLRIEYEGAYYHVTSRGNEQKAIFVDDKDKVVFLEILDKGFDRFRFFIHTFCLMTNHYHLLLETPGGNLSKIMHFVNTSYSTYFNRTHKRVGHLFQGRFKSILIEACSYARELSRYIHLNPVRAEIVRIPEEFPWSSYREFLADRKPAKWLRTDFVFRLFSENEDHARTQYKDYVYQGIHQPCVNPLEGREHPAILGNEEFIEQIKKRFLRKLTSNRELPAIKRIIPSPRLADIHSITESILGEESKRSRKISVYLARKNTERSFKEIGEFWDLNESAACQIFRRMQEEIANDPRLRDIVKGIEQRILLSDV